MERWGERYRRTQSDRRVAKEWERGGGANGKREGMEGRARGVQEDE